MTLFGFVLNWTSPCIYSIFPSAWISFSVLIVESIFGNSFHEFPSLGNYGWSLPFSNFAWSFRKKWATYLKLATSIVIRVFTGLMWHRAPRSGLPTASTSFIFTYIFSRTEKLFLSPMPVKALRRAFAIMCLMASHGNVFHMNEPHAWIYPHTTLRDLLVLVETVCPRIVIVEGIFAGVVVFPVVGYVEESWTSTILGRIFFVRLYIDRFVGYHRCQFCFLLLWFLTCSWGSSSGPRSKQYGPLWKKLGRSLIIGALMPLTGKSNAICSHVFATRTNTSGHLGRVNFFTSTPLKESEVIEKEIPFLLTSRARPDTSR